VARYQVIPFALLATLFASACGGVRCKRQEDSYSGRDVLPYEEVTAEEILAESEMHIVEQVSWIPDPSEYEGGAYGPTPPLPYEGSTRLEIEVTPLSDELIDEYSHSFEYGCEANGSPEAPVRITIRTSDGVLNEEVQGRLIALNDSAHVTATITEPKGRIKEYFADYEDPMIPTLSVEIEPGHARLQFVLERRRDNGASWDYVTLF
jgi:hypothetical protein